MAGRLTEGAGSNERAPAPAPGCSILVVSSGPASGGTFAVDGGVFGVESITTGSCPATPVPPLVALPMAPATAPSLSLSRLEPDQTAQRVGGLLHTCIYSLFLSSQRIVGKQVSKRQQVDVFNIQRTGAGPHLAKKIGRRRRLRLDLPSAVVREASGPLHTIELVGLAAPKVVYFYHLAPCTAKRTAHAT